MKTTNSADPITNLSAAYKRWEYIHEHGSSDPICADGVNLNLVRGHILSYKREIEDDYPLYRYHPLYQRELPPEVPSDYMARQDEIRQHAEESLARYEADPDYRYLARQRDAMDPSTVKKTYIDNVLGYARSLRMAIEGDDLVTMRRHERPETYLDSFKSCAEKVRACLTQTESSLHAEDEESVMQMTM